MCACVRGGGVAIVRKVTHQSNLFNYELFLSICMILTISYIQKYSQLHLLSFTFTIAFVTSHLTFVIHIHIGIHVLISIHLITPVNTNWLTLHLFRIVELVGVRLQLSCGFQATVAAFKIIPCLMMAVSLDWRGFPSSLVLGACSC